MSKTRQIPLPPYGSDNRSSANPAATRVVMCLGGRGVYDKSPSYHPPLARIVILVWGFACVRDTRVNREIAAVDA